jgi:hypothetical protein
MKTERVRRQVIEGKLLAALDDEAKVAVLLDQPALRLCIGALAFEHSQEAKELRNDLKALHEAAFWGIE